MLFEVLIIVLLSYFLVKHLRGQSKGNSPPGPWKFPILGNLLSVANAHPTFAHLAMHNLAKKYGPLMSIKYGVHDTVVCSSFDVIKEMLTRNEFAGRYDLFPFVPDRSFHQVLGIIFMSGDMWRDSRRFTIRHLRDVGFGKRTSMEVNIEEELAQFIAQVKSTSKECNGILRKIDPDWFSPSVVKILWYYIAGSRFDLEDKKLKTMIEHNVAVVAAFNLKNIAIPFPVLRHWFPSLTNYYEDMKAHTQLQDFVRELINEIRIEFNKKNKTSASEPQTLMEAYIQEIDRNPGKTNEESIFTEQHLIMIVKDLFLGGSETTSNTLAWSILFMILYPEVQSKIQSEIDHVLRKGATISMAHLEKLPYTEAVMMEIFRIAPVVPMPVPRKAVADGELNGYTISKGTCLFFNLYSVLMDEDYWGDPTVFRPERFLNESKTQVINKERMIMFGLGKKNCLGESLARNSFFVYFATLLQTFSFSNPPGQPIPSTEPQVHFTLKPQPYDAVATVRNEVNT